MGLTGRGNDTGRVSIRASEGAGGVIVFTGAMKKSDAVTDLKNRRAALSSDFYEMGLTGLECPQQFEEFMIRDAAH